MVTASLVSCVLVLVVGLLWRPPLLVHSCSCPEGLPPTRADAIRESFCYSENIYSGKVIEATCNCIPGGSLPSTLLNCQHYRLQFTQSIINATVLDQGRCDYPRYNNVSTSLCSTLANSLMTWGLTVEGPQPPSAVGEATPRNLTTRDYQDCNFACPFNEETRQPCTYLVRVNRVYKGNISEGVDMEVMGPDTLTTCGSPTLRLQISTDYVVGVGSTCGPLSDWTESSAYVKDELALLERLSTGEEVVDCGAWQLLPSSLLLAILLILST